MYDNTSGMHADDTLNAAIRTLQTLPEEDPTAVARIVATARVQRGTAGLIPDISRSRRIPLWRSVGAAFAAALVFGVGFVAGDSGHENSSANDAPVAAGPVAAVAMSQVAANDEGIREPLPIPTSFRLKADHAKHVSLVGDFNSWDPTSVPLVRSSGDGTWSGTIPLRPGRHTYAFMIDGRIVSDPDAVNIRDPDYDVIVSTIVVKELGQ